ncbi:MAG: efflux RND transporter periplasmic adaptor subunit [Paucibacter sp.]|nr:efflux RND transporter periplasmic adaptor subunit [Roseateles sp.]
MAVALAWPVADPGYETVAVERGDVAQTVRAYGTALPLELVQVGAEVSGQVVEVTAGLNAHVQKGQELARIRVVALEADLERAASEIRAAQAALTQRGAEQQRAKDQLDNRKRSLARQRQLVAQGFLSDSALDDALLGVKSAQDDEEVAAALRDVAASELERARLRDREAKATLARASVRSPIDGIVVGQYVKVGQTLAAAFQTPILFDVASSLKRMRLEIKVDEADIGEVAPGQPLTFTVDAFPAQDFSGAVANVQRQGRVADGATTFSVIAEFDNPQERILPGMTASVRIQTGMRHAVLRIPQAALQFRPNELGRSSLPRVAIVSPAEADRLRNRAAQAADPSPPAGRSRVWALREGPISLEAVDVELGLRGDDYVELLGQQLVIGERLAVRRKRQS